MPQWVHKKLLILGMTYPAYSQKYTENVCTGGVDAETGRLVRIHPVPRRYLAVDSEEVVHCSSLSRLAGA